MSGVLTTTMIGSAALAGALLLMLGLRLISPKRFAQLFAGLAAGTAVGLAVARLSGSVSHG